ncbi:ATP-binding cassette domain-containing protein [Xylocopilactobacillus apis]|uniref:ABC transporter ATP-binding protein n=1 Tax=Xylocopilactobacillus apis TaxID=2932183 RepID=A0AAU9D487_9LACO|nr:ABC transporter ATP-binding protein [Xylocopilactobacillus apis]BDR55652.1 hypothetical protein KIMC2_02140 [Xylocopilactobacillus apis]
MKSLFWDLIITKQKKKLIILIILSLLNTISKISLSYTMGWFINYAIGKQITLVTLCGLGSLTSLVMIYILTVSSKQIELDLVKISTIELKQTAYNNLLSDQESQFIKLSKDAQLNVLENTIPTIGQDYLLSLLSNFTYLIQIFLCSIALIFVNVKIFLICFLVSSIPMFINPKIRKKFGMYKKDLNLKSEEQLTMVNGFLNGLDTIRTFSAGKAFKNKLAALENSFEEQKKSSGVWDTRIVELSTLIGMSSQIICMLVAALFILYGKITVGDLTITTQLLNYIFPAINAFNSYHLKASATEPLRKELKNIFKTNDSTKRKTLKFVNGDLQINEIDFAYTKDKLIFKDFSTAFPQNKFTLVVGKSGAGKTTLMKILTGALTPAKGNIKIGNVDITKIDPHEFKKNMIYVDQNPTLFNGTVADNITLFNTNSIKKITDELNELGLTKLLDRHVTYNGNEISGGEKVRISLARALTIKPAIIILDEPDSGQDPQTAEKIKQVVMNLKDQTVIVISHSWQPNQFKNIGNIQTI